MHRLNRLILADPELECPMVCYEMEASKFIARAWTLYKVGIQIFAGQGPARDAATVDLVRAQCRPKAIWSES
jgi:hypothetical protein